MEIKSQVTVHLEKIDKFGPESDKDSGYIRGSNESLKSAANNDNEIYYDIESDTSESPEDYGVENKIITLYQRIVDEIKNLPKEEQSKRAAQIVSECNVDVIPKTLLEFCSGFFLDGDYGKNLNLKPDWLDIAKFQKGQQFSKDHLFGLFYAQLLSLFTLFSFEDGLKPLIITGKSSTPYSAFKRYLSTAIRVLHWYTEDPWTEGTAANQDINIVRKMHESVRRKLVETPKDQLDKLASIENPWCPALLLTRKDFLSTCPVPKTGQCPHLIIGQNKNLTYKNLSQTEMAMTQFGFFGLAILRPDVFGIHNATDDDLDAFCHVWRGIGYLLGVEDEYNFCRGSLSEIKQRSQDYLDYWIKPNFRNINGEWEHMLRCVVQGLNYYHPGSTYETCLLDLAKIMNLHVPRVYDSLSYWTWLRYTMIKFYFAYLVRIPGVSSLMNKRLLRCIKKAENYDNDKHAHLQRKSQTTLDSFVNEQKNQGLHEISIK